MAGTLDDGSPLSVGFNLEYSAANPVFYEVPEPSGAWLSFSALGAVRKRTRRPPGASVAKKIEREYQAVGKTRHQELADMLTSIIEGGIVVSKALASQGILVEQILQYRNYLRLLHRPRSAE